MTKKLVAISLFHIFCLGLLFVPDRYQGSVVLTVSGLNLRVLDAAAISLIILATAVLYTYIIKNFLPQIKQLKELAGSNAGNSVKKGNSQKNGNTEKTGNNGKQ